MKLLGNIIWLIFGGLHTAIEYFIAGLVLMITIIGIPFGLQSMKLGVLAIWPFGSKVKWKESQPGCLSMFMKDGSVSPTDDWCSPSSSTTVALHHHHWHSLGKDALSAGKAGPVTIRNGSCITNICYPIHLLYRRRYIVKLS